MTTDGQEESFQVVGTKGAKISWVAGSGKDGEQAAELNTMKTLIFLLVVCGSLYAGWRYEVESVDSYRLTVERIVIDRNIVVSLLKIHVGRNASLAVNSQSAQCMVTLADTPANSATDGQVVLTGAKILRPGEAGASIQTFIGVKKLDGVSGFTGGAGVRPVPASTRLDSFFTVSAVAGDYKLDKPIEIALLDGKPVTLVVSKAAKRGGFLSFLPGRSLTSSKP